ncbi:hypothetical protein NKH18_02745 [Streptomyces sp. M10(2022)]
MPASLSRRPSSRFRIAPARPSLCRISLARTGRAVVVLLLSSLPLTTGDTAAAADPADLPEKVSAMSWNLCGGYQGCVAWDESGAKLDRVVEAVQNDPSVAVVMLQEVCLGLHAEPLQERLGDEWVVRFRAAPRTPTGLDPSPVVSCLSDTRACPGRLAQPLIDDEQGKPVTEQDERGGP